MTVAAPSHAVAGPPAHAADPCADPAEIAELRATIRRVIESVSPPDRVQRLDEAEEFDDELLCALAPLGVLAIGAPEEVGGSGDVRHQIAVIEELAAGPTSMAGYFIASYATIAILSAWGRSAVARDVLQRALAGEQRVSLAVSEPDGGTDVATLMRTRATANPDGSFVIAGQKMWTSGAATADWIVVLARTAPIERRAVDGITAFLVPARAPGVEIRAIDTFGMRGLSTCEVYFDGVHVGPDHVVGDVHAGMRQIFSALDGEGMHAAAACVGVARAALALAVEHASSRVVFGKPIGAFQAPQHWLVDAAVAIESARGLLARAASVSLGGGDARHLADMAKLVASEAAQDTALKGMQLMGGIGYTRANTMQRLFRDARLWSFSPLNNEMVRNRLGQSFLGLPRSF